MATDITTGAGGLYDFAPRNLAQPVRDNIAGLQATWYTEARNILNWPAPDCGSIVIEQLELAPGAFWYQLVSVRGSVRHKQTRKDEGRQGESQTQKLTGALARNTDGLAAGLEALEARKLVVLYRDLNGLCWVVGTPTEPLTFRDNFDSGAEPFGSRNGYDWSLDGVTTRRVRPYAGTWQVAGGALQNAIELGAGAGGTVRVLKPDGTLMAIVPAGQDLIVRSAFRVAYTIQ